MAPVRAVRVGVRAAGHLWLFHHKPGRTDRQLAEIEADARQVFSRATTVARERAEFTLVKRRLLSGRGHWRRCGRA